MSDSDGSTATDASSIIRNRAAMASTTVPSSAAGPRGSAAAHQFLNSSNSGSGVAHFASPAASFPPSHSGTAMSSPSPDGSSVGHPGYIVRSRRADGMTPERRRDRVQWQLLMWVPFLLLLLHRQQGVAETTKGVVTVNNMMIYVMLPLIPIGCWNEYYDGFRLPTYVIALLVGFLWGVVRSETQDLNAAKMVAMMWFGFCAAKLRCNWDVKRLSSGRGPNGTILHPPPSHIAAAWNHIERSGGIAAFFLVGECASAFALPRLSDGISQLIDGAVGSLLFLTAPFVAVRLGVELQRYVPLLFQWWGGNYLAHHAVRNWRQTIVLIIAVVLSVAVFVLVLGYFLASYIPFVWAHSNWSGAIGFIVEGLVLNQLKDEARQARATRAAQRRLQEQQQQQHHQRQVLLAQQQHLKPPN